MLFIFTAAASFVLAGQASPDVAPAKAEYVLTGCTRHQQAGEQPAQKDMKKQENGQKKPAAS